MKNMGKVYLVGSGPGSYHLMTVKAIELLKKAQVLVYDNLVSKRAIDMHCPENCEKIYVGKKGSEHTFKQDEINEILSKKGKEEKLVVRLKGGDPFIFGRGAEEALHLKKNNIDFEIVNGITSAYSVPTFAGIPVTHRGTSASVAFITGHEDPEKNTTDINWDKISTGVQTLVILMGLKNISQIVNELVKNGRDSKTPVAIIQKGSTALQKTVTGTLENIVSIVKKEKVEAPSIIIVGDVVNLRKEINWFESKALFGKSIIVTRAREQASEFVSKLTELGADVIETPTIKIAAPDNIDEINKTIEKIESFDWLIFTSVNGVIYFYEYLYKLGLDSRIMSSNKICAIGPATADKLKEHGVIADFIPSKYVSYTVASELIEKDLVKGKSFLMPRADIAPPYLREKLLENGASQVMDLTIYKTIEEDPDESYYKEILIKSQFDFVTFTSSSTAKNFAKLLEKLGIKITKKIKCAAIGPVTADTARELGFNVEIVSEEHTIDGLVESLLNYFEEEISMV